MQKRMLVLMGAGVLAISLCMQTEAHATQSLLLKQTDEAPISCIGVASILETFEIDEETLQRAIEELNIDGYENLGIAQVDKYLNVRQEPGEGGKIIGKMPNDAACEIISETEDGWAQIKSGEIEGYVSLDYLLTGKDAILRAKEVLKITATVTADALKVRREPNTESEVITKVARGEQLEVIDTDTEGWVKVSLDDEGVYVSADYVTVGETLKTAITLAQLLYGEGVSDLRVDLCEYAKQFLGNPYVWGGTSLTKGADCSGFVLSVFKNFGYTLPHSSVSQSKKGTKVTASELQPGDLIFYGVNSTVNHVAIYIGGGKVIHASSKTTGIKISNYTYRTPYAMRRILP